jgi:hypothetical protein
VVLVEFSDTTASRGTGPELLERGDDSGFRATRLTVRGLAVGRGTAGESRDFRYTMMP